MTRRGLPRCRGDPHARDDGANRLRRVDRWIAGRLRPAAAGGRRRWSSTWGTAPAGHHRRAVHPAARGPARSRGRRDRDRPGAGRGGAAAPARGAVVPARRLRAARRAAAARCIRAFNVLRQYEEAEASTAWTAHVRAAGAGRVLVEGTCDEIGRVASWVARDAGEGGPRRRADDHLRRARRVVAPPSDAGRTAAQDAHPPQRAGRAGARLLTAFDRAWAASAPRSVSAPGSAGSARSSCWPASTPSTPRRRSADALAGDSARSRSPGRPPAG